MTRFHDYDELTWPEVSSLPRNIPIILPLGSGFNKEQIAEAFGKPEDIFILPVFPYGWRGSGLEVPDTILKEYLENLIASLRDDGFSNCSVLMPQGLNISLNFPWIALPISGKSRITQPVPDENSQRKVVLIPIGHTEQHAFHLPLSTDTLIIDSIAKGTVLKIPDFCISLPTMPYGVSTHRKSFAGTLNASGRAFEDFWVAAIDFLVSRGFSMFYLMSGHGGNTSFIINAIKYAGERHNRIFCATAWLYLSGPEGIASLEKYRESIIGGMGHACELETSMILNIKPELVHMERVVDETDFLTTPSYYMDWIEGGALIANPPWDDDTKTGAYGSGSLATSTKGKIWLEAAISEKAKHVQEIHEQHRMREERRMQGYGMWGK